MGERAFIVVGVLSVALAACGDDGSMTTSDGGMDAAAMDATPDTGSDSGAAMDSAHPDVGTPRDGGRTPDATATDASSDAAADAVDTGPLTAMACFAGAYTSMPPVAPVYEPFMPTVGSHCLGTNHQDITGVERVVFLGDSVTVGSPPTLSGEFYRSRLADALASHFGIDAPNALWKTANPLDGRAGLMESGDFASCAEWGARTDDLLGAGNQLESCFPASSRDLRTLVVMTMGGNDVASITQDGVDGVPIPDIWDDVRQFVQYMEDAVLWLKEPGRFPNGVYVIFANMFEFTDGTGDVTACPSAELAGFGAAWDDPSILADMVIYAEEQYLRIAVETGTDMIFMLEEFCGHGFNHTDSSAPCYRGPGTPRWFDLTCIHPNPDGHRQIADMFFAVVDE
jgi:lysophospholipase L1-like esterase